MKRAFTVLLLLLLPSILPTCGGVDQGSSTARRFFSLGTAPPGGAFFVVGGAIAEVLNENPGERGWQFTAEATKGTQENIRRLSRGELDLAMANSSITYFAVRGEEGWERPYDVRAVMTLAPNVALFITPSNSGIRKLADLKGRRVVVGVAGAGFEFFVRPLLAAHGVSFDDFTPLYSTQMGSVDMLADGSAAAAMLGGAIPTASIVQASSSQDIYFVPFGDQEKAQLIERYPFFEAAVIPVNTYPGQEEEYHGLNVGSMHVIASAEQEEGLIYDLTRTLWENRAGLVAKHPAGRSISEANAPRNTGTPFHAGAERFYREIGIWPGEDSPE